MFPTASRFLGLALAAVPVLAMAGFLNIPIGAKPIWFLWVVGIAFYLAGSFAARGAAVFGAVVFSLFVGGSAQLWLTEPLWFPAIQLRPKSAVDLLMFGLIGLQAATAVWVLRESLVIQKIMGWLRHFGLWRIVLFLGLSFAFSVSIQGSVPRGFYVSYVLHLIAASAMITVNLASLAAMLSVSPPQKDAQLFNPAIMAFVVLVASGILTWFGFERLPHVEDETVYLFQAKTFAHGALSAAAPHEALRPGLEFYLLDIRDGRWFSTTPHGWPAILTIGVLFGAPWLVNPILGGASVLFAHSIARQLAGRMQADILVLLMAASPWFLQSSASLMPHNTAIFFTLASWWLLLRATGVDRGKWALAGAAGLAMGWVFATRQLEGVIIGTLTGSWLLWHWQKGDGPARTIAYSLGAIAAGSSFFAYNYAMTGDILLAPLERYLSEYWHVGANAYGFGPDIGPAENWGALDMSPGHSPVEGVFNTLHNLSALQLELFGWGVGSLALVYVLFLWGRPKGYDLAMSAICFFIAAAMFFYWASGGFYLGPRYWYSMFFPILFLSSGGYLVLSKLLTDGGIQQQAPSHLLLVVCLFGLLVFTPWRGVEKFNGYNSYRTDIARLASEQNIGNAVVFFDTPKNPESAIHLNDPFLPDDQPVFLVDKGEDINRAAMHALPSRNAVYLATPAAK